MTIPATTAGQCLQDMTCVHDSLALPDEQGKVPAKQSALCAVHLGMLRVRFQTTAAEQPSQ